MTRVLYSNRVQLKGLNATAMLILLEDGLAENIQTQMLFYPALVSLYLMLVAQSIGTANFRLKFCFSTTEEEYVALYMAMREVLPFLNLVGESKTYLPVTEKDPDLFCTIWEDNQSTMKDAESPKFTMRTKHIALKYHHFRQFVSNEILKINPIDTLELTADIFTKPLDQAKFEYI